MSILCTHPGRHGDLLWALPTIGAIATAAGEPVDLLVSGKYGSSNFLALLDYQSYLHRVFADHAWTIEETAPITPRVPPTIPEGYDRVVHLGYDGWPSDPLPYEIYKIAARQQIPRAAFAVGTPWITPPPFAPPLRRTVTVGFTDEHFEVKYGLTKLLTRGLLGLSGEREAIADVCNVSGGPRWQTEGGCRGTTWPLAAMGIAGASVFVGCCSALHVLACAMGVPAIVVEPAPARHHEIFYPLGKDGRFGVELLKGGDGLPTLDSRHLVDAVRTRLQRAA